MAKFRNDELRKAFNTLPATTGDVLIPSVVEPIIRDFIDHSTPIWNLMNPRDWPTNLYQYRERTGVARATFKADDVALPAATRGTYVRRDENMKYIYQVGSVSGPLKAASLYDAAEIAIEDVAEGMALTLEEAILVGNEGTDPTSINGLMTQVTRKSNSAAEATPVLLTPVILDEALDFAKADTIISNGALHRRLWAVLQAQQQFVNEIDIDGGFRVPTYQGRPIVRINEEECPTAATAMVNTMLLVDRSKCILPINEDVKLEMLGKARDADDFFIKMYLCLAVEGVSKRHAKLVGVKAS